MSKRKKSNKPQVRRNNKTPRHITTPNFQIEERAPFIGIPVVWNEKEMYVPIEWKYEVQDHTDGIIVSITISQHLFDKVKTATIPFTLGQTPGQSNPRFVRATWPTKYDYLSTTDQEHLKQRNVIRDQYLMMDNIAHLQFGEYIYTKN